MQRTALEASIQGLGLQIERLRTSGGGIDQQTTVRLLEDLPLEGEGIEIRKGYRAEKFKRKVKHACNSRHPLYPTAHQQWCPILSGWYEDVDSSAMHIFPYAGGQHLMDLLFGQGICSTEESFEASNGLMMSKYAEDLLDQGIIALVPNLRDDATADQRGAWTEKEVKDYKIRILDKNHSWMNHFLPSNDTHRWRDLDNREVAFRSDHRPEVRYLYWRFAISRLRRKWQYPKPPGPLDDNQTEKNKSFWGVKGPWINRRYLLSLAQKLGHDVDGDGEGIMEAAKDDDADADAKTEDDNHPDPVGVLVAAQHIEYLNLKIAAGRYPVKEKNFENVVPNVKHEWENLYDSDDEEKGDDESDEEDDSSDDDKDSMWKTEGRSD